MMRRAALALAFAAAWTDPLPVRAGTETSNTATVAATPPLAAVPPELVTDLAREDEPSYDPLLRALDLPASAVETAFSPLRPIVYLAEKYQLHLRAFDLLTNEEHTLAIAPLVDVFNHSGFGAGAALIQNKPLGSADRLVFLTLARVNGDVNTSVSISRRLPTMNGREISFSAGYGFDYDLRYYGLHGEGTPDERRLIQVRSIDLAGGFILLSPDLDWNVRVDLAFRHRSLSPGKGDEPSLTLDGPLTIPTGFNQSLDYPEATVSVYYDTRDSFGRTSSGVVATLEGTATHDLNGAETGSLRATGSIKTFIPVLPLNRIVFLSGGVSLATSLDSGGTPLHQLVQLGGSNTLRGYNGGRFVDRLGWWGTAEYRYNIYEYAETGNGFSATVFGDLGQVGPNPEETFKSTLRWSVGLGVRVETDLFLLGRLQLAYSPEGVQITLGIGEVQ